MIVGTKAIPLDKLRSECRSIDSLRAFSLSLVPRYFQHIPEIVDNQKYLVAVEVRALKSLPYAKRKYLSEGLLTGVVIRGTINTLIDSEDILASVNMSQVFKVLFKEELKEVIRNGSRTK